jgi:hypothetical protein
LEAPLIIAMDQGDAFIVKRNVTKRAMARLPCRLDRSRELPAVGVAVPEDEVRRPRGEEFNNFGRAYVAAVKDALDFEAFKHSHRRPHKFDMAVTVADHSNSHGVIIYVI